MTAAPTDVLLSVTMLRADERQLLDALRARGLAPRTCLPQDLGEVLSGRESPPAMGVIRNLSHREAFDTARRLEQLGTTAYNTATTIDTCGDKGLQALLFSRHEIPHPRSLHAFNDEQVHAAAATLGWPAVVKPVSGSWGRGVTRVEDEDSLRVWSAAREAADAAGRSFPVLVQEHVDKPGHDLRVVVVGEEPVAAIRRASADWKTNTHLGARVERTTVTEQIRDLCARVVAALGPGFYGVDLVEDRSTGSLLVLEVNANPEFARSSEIHGVDVAGRLADRLTEELTERTAGHEEARTAS
ncbi:RimK family alpha-L-glutamate ligase [Actinopolyspora mortivallis]|uniref:RimK family alpha-L-glutamate ligase n=1 Tax=Actinopolyspora mortivallis TaxID=33906 RepID=UPI00036F0F8E|nr:RimK family alpha-L-glutamate ligase [Actinopolyspora mortivallis]